MCVCVCVCVYVCMYMPYILNAQAKRNCPSSGVCKRHRNISGTLRG